ncbi:hypothetical protein [Ruegeria sp. YS9]|uniref:hypothetical protein n=1 Tax=Ruegeria sp. YS9 TaxID=2966453 RepID=UPI00214BCDE2|nr:hypothetical protein [Ruegeria sp. YS9]UUV07613.1 hypothetical protein NOR97_07635 [Ruegeria sp. YS9]
MKHFAKFVAVSTFFLMPGNGFAEILHLKANGAEMHCTAKHDCNPPLDCGGDDFKDCKPRKGYCKDSLSFAFQPLKAEDTNDQKQYGMFALAGHEKFVLSGAKIALENQQNEVLVLLKGQPPLDDFENWDVMLSDSGRISVHVKLTSGVPSVASFRGACQVAN